MQHDLFADPQMTQQQRTVQLGPGALLLGGFALEQADALLAELAQIAAAAPFRRLETPAGVMSVAMTNCGATGWVSDRRGYRYDPVDPLRNAPWPDMPPLFLELAATAAQAAGFANYRPDACLLNCYHPGTKLSLHQDRDEKDAVAPIVSVSLGLPAMFLWGGATRRDRPQRIALAHGDVVVFGGPSRMMFHGVDTISDGQHPLTGAVRYNLTFRKTS